MKLRDTLTVLLGFMMVNSEVPAVRRTEIFPPPTDVEVSCQNLQVKVGWNYSGQPQSNFTVTIWSANWHEVFTTVEHQYDLTKIIWSSDERYMSNYYVMVTATVGSNQSKPASSKSFTFNDAKTATLRCQIDFPPLKLVRKGLDLSLSFSNPFHFYRELKEAAKMDSATFRVALNSDVGSENFVCRTREKTCRYDFVSPSGETDCFTLEGTLFEGNNVGQVVAKKESICAITEFNSTLWIAISITLAIITLTVTVTVVKCCLSMKPAAQPTALQWNYMGKQILKYHIVSPEDTCMVHIVSRNQPEPSLIFSEDLQDSMAHGGPEDESSGPEPAGVGRSSGGYGSLDIFADYLTESMSIDFSSEQSAYNSPKFPIMRLVAISNEDMATGYKG